MLLMILCCGEALIDMIPTVNESEEPGFTPCSGGSVFNTAVALGRLGSQVGLLSGLSSDFFGDQLMRSLAESNVDTGMAIRSNRPTTLAFVQLINDQANYTFYDENTAGRLLCSESLPKIAKDVSTLYFGGISLINEPCANFYTELAIRESASKVIVVDPNIRSSLIENEETYRARLSHLIMHADIVKVSDEDLHWIVPGPLSLKEKIDKINADGSKLVILTQGSEGALAIAPDGATVEVEAQKATVADTVGAGDTFNAGVLAKLFEIGCLSKAALQTVGISEMKEALEYGVHVAAITVSRSGADSPWANELAKPT